MGISTFIRRRSRISPMPGPPRSAVARYGSAVLVIALATVLRLWLNPVLEGSGFALFLAAVVVAAWFGGLGPSLLALIASLFVSAWFFSAPAGAAPEPPARM